LTGPFGKSAFEIFLYIFLFSFIAYVVHGFIPLWLKIGISEEWLGDKYILFISDKSNIHNVVGAAFVSIFLAFIFSYIYTFGLINRFAKLIRASNRYGDEDVWHFFHNAPLSDKNNGWIYVRDHKLNLIYLGYVSAWSESDKTRELIISDVTVYNDDANLLYETDHIYISRKKDDITIEIPDLSKMKNNEKGENNE